MINLIYIPCRSNIKIKYGVSGDSLTVKINDIEEVFDFTGLQEGIAEEIIVEKLPINPIISAKKTGDTVNVTVIRFYSADEKEVFENGDN